VAFTVAVLGAAAFPADAREVGPSAPRVRVATTPPHAELRETLPIAADARARKRVVMSMGPRQLPSLADGDKLELSAELQLTTDCVVREPRCAGMPYRYSPVAQAQLVLAANRRTAAGARALPLGRPQREVCGQRPPHREHHCVIVFDGVSHQFEQGEPPPCPIQSCHVNLVVEAHHRRASRRDRVSVGGLKPDGRIPQDRGRINAVRISGEPGAHTLQSERRSRRGLTPDHRGRVVYSVRLGGLRSDEQLAVTGLIETRIRHLPYNTLNGAQLVLARDRRSIKPDRRVRRISTLSGEISERNAYNCTQIRPSCASRKVGVIRMLDDAIDARGRAIPLYVNLVMVNGVKHANRRPGDRIRVGRAGGLEVTRYPAELAG
jgi:hypothetical protein